MYLSLSDMFMNSVMTLMSWLMEFIFSRSPCALTKAERQVAMGEAVGGNEDDLSFVIILSTGVGKYRGSPINIMEAWTTDTRTEEIKGFVVGDFFLVVWLGRQMPRKGWSNVEMGSLLGSRTEWAFIVEAEGREL